MTTILLCNQSEVARTTCLECYDRSDSASFCCVSIGAGIEKRLGLYKKGSRRCGGLFHSRLVLELNTLYVFCLRRIQFLSFVYCVKSFLTVIAAALNSLNRKAVELLLFTSVSYELKGNSSNTDQPCRLAANIWRCFKNFLTRTTFFFIGNKLICCE